VRVSELAKRYGPVPAVRSVSFEVARGEIFGLLGPNGAGKTTVLECLLGLRTPDAGALTVNGVDARAEPERARARVGAQIQLGQLPGKIRVREALDLFASFYPDPVPTEQLIARFGLAEKAQAPFDSLSGGQRQRLLLALAFVNNPTLVVLDEPTAGLDARSRRELHRLILGLKAAGHTVLMSTHYLEEASQLCDRIAILSEGRVVAVGSPADIVSRAKALPRIEVKTTRALSEAEGRALDGASACRVQDERCWIETPDLGRTLTALMGLLQREGIGLLDLKVHRRSLEDVFIEVTGRPWDEAGGEE